MKKVTPDDVITDIAASILFPNLLLKITEFIATAMKTPIPAKNYTRNTVHRKLSNEVIDGKFWIAAEHWNKKKVTRNVRY